MNLTTKKTRLYLILGFLMIGSLLASCTGGAGVTTSWPGVTIDADRDSVYVASGAHIYSVNLANGLENWRFPSEADNKISFFAAPEISENAELLVGDYNNILYRLNPDNNGQVIWQFTDAKSQYIAASLAEGDGIFAPNGDRNLYALNKSGNQKWHYETEHALWGKPVTDGSVVYFTSMDHHVYALKLESGDLVWKSDDLGGAIAGNPTLSPEGVLYVGTFGAEMLALDIKDGSVKWRTMGEGWIWSGPTLDGDTLYFGDLSGALFAVSADDGAVIWKVNPDQNPKAAISDRPLVLEDTLYIVNESGSIFAVDKTTGNTRWSRAIDKAKLYASPAAAGDFIIVAPVGADAMLYGFDLNGNPKWQFNPAK